mgnify:CR=1 FL=1
MFLEQHCARGNRIALSVRFKKSFGDGGIVEAAVGGFERFQRAGQSAGVGRG